MTDCSLYLVSPPKLVLAEFLPKVQEAFAGSTVKAFQLRLKDASDAEILEAAREILPFCRARDIAFILNDSADLAVKCDVDGIHLGQDDMPVAKARKILGDDKVIGVSCHASPDQAMTAAEEGADYVAFGAFYPTTSKPMEKVEKWGVPTPEILQWWSTFTTIPCVAIGGITPANCAPLIAAGTDFIAAITSVWNHPKGPGAAVKEFAGIINALESGN
jgi:thiamine-phosphate pyrophosphorylase